MLFRTEDETLEVPRLRQGCDEKQDRAEVLDWKTGRRVFEVCVARHS